MKNLKTLAEQTSIPIWRFKQALGMELEPCTAKTVTEAREAYRSAPDGSEAQAAALKRWSELSITRVAAAKTLTEAQEVYIFAPDSAEGAVLLRLVELCTTIEEAEKIYDLAPDGSDALTAALRKMVELSPDE